MFLIISINPYCSVDLAEYLTLLERENDSGSFVESESSMNMSFESQDMNMSVEIFTGSLPGETSEVIDLEEQFEKLKEKYAKLESKSEAQVAQIKSLKTQLKMARKEIAALEAEKDDASDSDDQASVDEMAHKVKRNKDNRLSPYVILILMKIMARGIPQESYQLNILV